MLNLQPCVGCCAREQVRGGSESTSGRLQAFSGLPRRPDRRSDLRWGVTGQYQLLSGRPIRRRCPGPPPTSATVPTWSRTAFSPSMNARFLDAERFFSHEWLLQTLERSCARYRRLAGFKRLQQVGRAGAGQNPYRGIGDSIRNGMHFLLPSTRSQHFWARNNFTSTSCILRQVQSSG